MSDSKSSVYVSRGGDKLAAALDHFKVGVSGRICADVGSHVGGFVDCLLQRGAARVYSIDTAYGTLAWKLRRDPRVEVFERTNAMHVSLPEPVDLVTVDAGWTPQARILSHAGSMLAGSSSTAGASADRPVPLVITLVKPHYEAPKEMLRGGVLPEDQIEAVVRRVLEEAGQSGWVVLDRFASPIKGHGGNREHFALLSPPPVAD